MFPFLKTKLRTEIPIFSPKNKACLFWTGYKVYLKNWLLDSNDLCPSNSKTSCYTLVVSMSSKIFRLVPYKPTSAKCKMKN